MKASIETNPGANNEVREIAAIGKKPVEYDLYDIYDKGIEEVLSEEVLGIIKKDLGLGRLPYMYRTLVY